MDRLSGAASIATVALGSVIKGLSNLPSAYADAEGRKGNWGVMLGNVREGAALIERALPYYASTAGPAWRR